MNTEINTQDTSIQSEAAEREPGVCIGSVTVTLAGKPRESAIPMIVVDGVISAKELCDFYPEFVEIRPCDENPSYKFLSLKHNAYLYIDPSIEHSLDFGSNADYIVHNNAVFTDDLENLVFERKAYDELVEQHAAPKRKPKSEKRGKQNGGFADKLATAIAGNDVLASLMQGVTSISHGKNHRATPKYDPKTFNPALNGNGYFVIPQNDNGVFINEPMNATIGKLSRLFSLNGLRPFMAPLGVNCTMVNSASLLAAVTYMSLPQDFENREEVLGAYTSRLSEILYKDEVTASKLKHIEHAHARIAMMVWMSFSAFRPTENWLTHNPTITNRVELVQAFMRGAYDEETRQLRKIVCCNVRNQNGTIERRPFNMASIYEHALNDIAYLFKGLTPEDIAKKLDIPFNETTVFSRAIQRDERYVERANRNADAVEA